MSEVNFLVGREVMSVEPANGVRIVFDLGTESEPPLYADLMASEWSCLRIDGSRYVSEGSDEDIASLSTLTGFQVTDASTADATLSLAFTDGSSLLCPPHERYEAWQVVGGTPQFLVVCPSGGGELAVWDTSSPGIRPALRTRW